MTTGAPAARSGLERWAGLGGVAYVVLFVTGVIVSFSGAPETDEPVKMVAYWSDSGHRDQSHIGWLLVVFGVFFLIWFLGGLRQVLRQTEGDGFLTGIATIGGAVYATTTLVAISINDAINTMSDDTFHHQVYPSLIHAASDASYVIHSSGGIGLAALIIAASVVAMRAGRIPGWAGWVSIVIGFLSILSVFFFPQILVALWLLIAGFAVFRAGTPVAGPAAGV